MPVVCLAIVGQQNNPLYVKTFPEDDEERDLKFQFIVHCSLDMLEDKVLHRRPASDSGGDFYLGMLYPSEEFRAYGYISNTHIKFIAVVDNKPIRDDAVGRLLRLMHGLYIDTFSNPFFALPLATPKFDAAVKHIVAAASDAA